MKPYSLDLRQRVAAAVDGHEGTWHEIAARFSVSVSFLARLLRQRRRTNSLAPRPHGGGHPPAYSTTDRDRLRQFVQEQPDATLAELRQRLGRTCSLTALWRTLRQLRLTRKKKTLRADQQNTPTVQAQRATFHKKVARLDPHRLIFIDETGATTAMTRTYGRAACGERVYGSVSGMRLSGVVAPLAFAGATDTTAFQSYVEQALVPQLQAGDIVIWDNLKPHHNAEVIRAIQRAGAEVYPLPPWSPDLTPIEKMFSKVKEYLRSAATRTTEALVEAMGTALRAVCPQDIQGWFRSCGLCATQRLFGKIYRKIVYFLGLSRIFKYRVLIVSVRPKATRHLLDRRDLYPCLAGRRVVFVILA
jgi:transposase